MSFPPLDVPVAVTPVVVALPYDVAPRPVGATAYLSLVGGILATAQGVLVSLLTMYLMLKLGALWSATSGDQLGLSDSMRSTIQNQLLIDLLLLGILLLINVGLAIAAGLMMTSSIFETRRETAAQPQPAINAGLVAGLYLVILLSLAILYYFTQQPATGGLLANYSPVRIRTCERKVAGHWRPNFTAPDNWGFAGSFFIRGRSRNQLPKRASTRSPQQWMGF